MRHMRYLPGGVFTMGSEHFYPEEAPLRCVEVEGFWIDDAPVTNEAFAHFVEATGHVTVAELAIDPSDYPGMDMALAQPGSLVFRRTREPVDLADASQWWSFVVGANWRHPYGPESSLLGIGDHPVVHVAHADALAYARWAGKSLPTETEWEFAARGGLDRANFAWGDALNPGGQMLANYWQGRFPCENTLEDGYERTSPVRAYPANGYGLHDMIGNVWEWTGDWYATAGATCETGRNCCTPRNHSGGTRDESLDTASPQMRVPRKVLKGGSHLCAPSYCQRYRPAARQGQAIDTSTSHIGFRCVVRQGQVSPDFAQDDGAGAVEQGGR
jgi:sulfatase modifying factor 1